MHVSRAEYMISMSKEAHSWSGWGIIFPPSIQILGATKFVQWVRYSFTVFFKKSMISMIIRTIMFHISNSKRYFDPLIAQREAVKIEHMLHVRATPIGVVVLAAGANTSLQCTCTFVSSHSCCKSARSPSSSAAAAS